MFTEVSHILKRLDGTISILNWCPKRWKNRHSIGNEGKQSPRGALCDVFSLNGNMAKDFGWHKDERMQVLVLDSSTNYTTTLRLSIKGEVKLWWAGPCLSSLVILQSCMLSTIRFVTLISMQKKRRIQLMRTMRPTNRLSMKQAPHLCLNTRAHKDY